MSLSSSISIAASGLRATQAGMDVVSQNVANAGSVGYTRRVLDLEQQVAGGRTVGVAVGAANRVLDATVQRQLRLEEAGASYTGTKAAAQAALSAIFDRPGGAGSLPTLLNAFTSSLNALANNPAAYANRASVLAAGAGLAGSLNDLAGQVQSMRQDAEDKLGVAVTRADGLLQAIARANAQVVSDPTSAALQDGRDGLIDQLATLMDVKVTAGAGGSVSLSTTGGLLLFDGIDPTRLAFDGRSPLSAQSAYDPDPSKRGTGTITAQRGAGSARDVLSGGLIRSGEIAALVDLRDGVLPQAAAQLDELAAGLAAALSDRDVAGTAATSGGADGFDLDLGALQPGNTVTLSVTGPGGPRTLTFVAAASAAGAAAASDEGRIGLDLSGGPAAVAARVAAALGNGYAVSNPAGSTLRILDDGAAGLTGVAAARASVTATGLAGGTAELPLFVDGGAADAPYTGSYEAGPQRVGFAGRIRLNPAVAADPGSLVVYGSGIAAADATRPTFLLDRLASGTRSFSGAAGIGGSSAPYSGTVVEFAQRIVETQAADATAAATLHDGQEVVVNGLRDRYAADAGVSIDSELTLLIELQTAYGANARVLSAARDMMDMLLRMGA